MIALLAEAAAAAAPEAGAAPAWVTTLLGVATVVLGVLKALDASRVAQLQGALRATKDGLRVVATVLDKLDGDEDPQEIKDKVRAESTAAGTEPVLKATLAEIRGGAPKPPASPGPGLNGVAPALLLALCLGAGCCPGREATVEVVREARVLLRRPVAGASPEWEAARKTFLEDAAKVAPEEEK